MPSVVALIPARAGSSRVPHKNVRALAGRPMLAYTIAPAIESGVFESVIVSTDSEDIAAIARHYGAEVPLLRPAPFASDTSPDIEWLEHLIPTLQAQGRSWDAFSLLRPTSPFRSAGTIRRAWDLFIGETGVDSLRAIEKCTQHPGKMWVVEGKRMKPLLDQPTNLEPRGRGPEPRAPAREPRAPDREPRVPGPVPALAQHAVPGASADLRPERLARNRLDAGRLRGAYDCRRRHRSLPDRRVRGVRHQRPARLDGGRTSDCRRRGGAAAGAAGPV